MVDHLASIDSKLMNRFMKTRDIEASGVQTQIMARMKARTK